MADKIEVRMNLAAIKRVDPYAKDIVDTSAHVAFYTFNSEENEWEKTDVEGVFFIYSRNAEPLHSIFINNRLNTNSFVEPITSQLELQSQPPFLLYRNERSRIRGFWFYNESECERIGDLVSRLIKECEEKITALKNHEMMKPSGNNVDIFTMLSKAQEDFNNAQNQVKVENRMTQATNPTDMTSQSVMNFFAAAKPAAASEVPLFQRLLSNPVSVDQIEKQQRATTPLEGRGSPPHALNIGQPGSSSGMDAGIKLMTLNSPKQNNTDLANSSVAKFFGSPNMSLPGSSKNSVPPDSGENSQKSLQQLLKKDSGPHSAKPALMPPTMFISSNSKPSKDSTHPSGIFGITRQQSEPGSSQSGAGFAKPEPLTQTQLLQAMLYLIQHDPDFVKKLHEAYLKSFKEMLSPNIS